MAEAKKVQGIWKRHRRKNREPMVYPAYESMYQPDKDYSKKQAQIRAVAFYLPQFHTFPENDAWWGEGFTEWSNTEKCTARFPGHYQPRRPHPDIGFYDLRAPEVMQRQVKLAQKHQLYGFCFYYYWFSGKTLMQRPLEIFLDHPEWKLHFCLCWANENFTRAWDGAEQEILMKQEYRASDPQALISSLKKYMQDPRYIRAGGKPVLLIYDMGSILDLKKTIRKWREEAKSQGIGEIRIWMCRTYQNTARRLGIEAQIDAEVEFPPHNMWWPVIREAQHSCDEAKVFSYPKLVELVTARIGSAGKQEQGKPPLYRTCMMGWDNACRRQKGWTVYYGYSLRLFDRWLRAIVQEAGRKRAEQRMFFVNAWNEWGEGTYLEPDEKYGYANINTLSENICCREKIQK